MHTNEQQILFTPLLILTVTLLLSSTFQSISSASKVTDKTFSVPEVSLDGTERTWNVGIGKMLGDSEFQVLCGGVRNRWNQIITSASCLDDNMLVCSPGLQCEGKGGARKEKESKVNVNANVMVLDGHRETHEIRLVDLHPGYKADSNKDDIAVLTIQNANSWIRANTFPEVTDMTTDSIFDQPEFHQVTEWTSYNISVGNRQMDCYKDSGFQDVMQISSVVRLDKCEMLYRQYFQRFKDNAINANDNNMKATKTKLDFDTVFPRGFDSTLLCITNIDSHKETCEKQTGFQLIAFRQTVHKHVVVSAPYLLGTRTKDRTGNATDCKARRLPLVFTNVLVYKDWISSLI